MKLFQTAAVAGLVAVACVTGAIAAQAQSYAWRWQQVNGPWTGQVLRTNVASCHVTGEVCRCNNVCGATRPFNGELFYHANGCANPPLRLRCVNMGGPPPVATQAAPRVAQKQGRQIEPPITGPNCPRTGARSPHSSTRAKVTFLNSHQPGKIAIFWIDFNGNSVHYADVQRGQNYVVNSFVGHVWVALDAQGRCIATTAAPAGAPTLAF